VTSSGGALLLRRLSVAGQIASVCVLLAAAGLFLRTVEQSVPQKDLGFRRDHLCRITVDPQLAGYTGDRVTRWMNAILALLHALPGRQIRSSGAQTNDPRWGQNMKLTTLDVPGYKAAKKR